MNRNATKYIAAFALILGAASASLKAYDLAPNFSIGGFVSNGYIKSSDYNYLVNSEEGDADFVEMAINATWTPLDKTRINAQLFAFELGSYGNYDPLIDYLFIDYTINDKIGFRAGRIKRPSGVYNEIQDIDVARTTVLLPVGMYDQRYRDFSASLDGVSAYGSLFFGDSQSIEYTIYYGKIDIGPEGGIGAYATTLLQASFSEIDVRELSGDKNYGGQLWWTTPIDGLRLGYAYSYYPDLEVFTVASFPSVFPASPALAGAPLEVESVSDVTRHQLSAEYYLGEWTFVGEYLIEKTDSLQTRSIFGMAQPTTSNSGDAESWYLSVSRRFLEKFEGGISYAEYYGDKTTSNDPSSFVKDWQFALRYDATDWWSLKVEYHDFYGTGRLFNQLGQNQEIEDYGWSMWAIKSTLSFQ